MMADLEKLAETPHQQLWELLEYLQAGMLGLQGLSMHMQTMAHFPEPAASRIWFFSKLDTELVRGVGMGGVGMGGVAHFCVTSPEQDYDACIRGAIRQNLDRARVAQLWTPWVGAWYENGQEDPQLSLLEMTCSDASIWASTESAARVGWEVAKANVIGGEPDVGGHRLITFS